VDLEYLEATFADEGEDAHSEVSNKVARLHEVSGMSYRNPLTEDKSNRLAAKAMPFMRKARFAHGIKKKNREEVRDDVEDEENPFDCLPSYGCGVFRCGTYDRS